jgi:hypothetical protein
MAQNLKNQIMDSRTKFRVIIRICMMIISFLCLNDLRSQKEVFLKKSTDFNEISIIQPAIINQLSCEVLKNPKCYLERESYIYMLSVIAKNSDSIVELEISLMPLSSQIKNVLGCFTLNNRLCILKGNLLSNMFTISKIKRKIKFTEKFIENNGKLIPATHPEVFSTWMFQLQSDSLLLIREDCE